MVYQFQTETLKCLEYLHLLSWASAITQQAQTSLLEDEEEEEKSWVFAADPAKVIPD